MVPAYSDEHQPASKTYEHRNGPLIVPNVLIGGLITFLCDKSFGGGRKLICCMNCLLSVCLCLSSCCSLAPRVSGGMRRIGSCRIGRFCLTKILGVRWERSAAEHGRHLRDGL